MTSHVEELEREIGKTIREARLNKGYESRASLVGTKKLAGKITQEGLRKIEAGERVPRLENLRMIAEALGLKEKAIKSLEQMALRANVERAVKRSGNANVMVAIQGKPLRIAQLPPKRKTEAFVRGAVTELLDVVKKYGVGAADEEHFRQHARAILLRRLEHR
jgi:predicted transcriptional regulator